MHARAPASGSRASIATGITTYAGGAIVPSRQRQRPISLQQKLTRLLVPATSDSRRRQRSCVVVFASASAAADSNPQRARTVAGSYSAQHRGSGEEISKWNLRQRWRRWWDLQVCRALGMSKLTVIHVASVMSILGPMFTLNPVLKLEA
jgi:hypothetical protein